MCIRDSDLYGGFSQQTFACKLYYNMTPNLPFNYTTSRCEMCIRDRGSSGEYWAMGESLTQQRRVKEEGLRVVNFF